MRKKLLFTFILISGFGMAELRAQWCSDICECTKCSTVKPGSCCTPATADIATGPNKNTGCAKGSGGWAPCYDWCAGDR